MSKKMIRNYVPFVKIENPNDRRRGPKKETTVVAVPKKNTIKVPQPEPKDYLEKKEEEKPEEEVIETEFSKQRKHFLLCVPYCSYEQVGVVFQLINKYAPDAIEYTDQGRPNIQMDAIPDVLMKRLLDQLDMWGIGYVSSKKKWSNDIYL